MACAGGAQPRRRRLGPHFSPAGWASAGKVFFGILQRFIGSHQGTNCAGRTLAWWNSQRVGLFLTL